MLDLKSFLLGIAGAVIAAAVWVLVSFVLPLYAPILIDKRGMPFVDDDIWAYKTVLASQREIGQVITQHKLIPPSGPR